MVSPCRVRIDHVGAGGDGVGYLADGAAVYLPGTLPGELVTARVVHQRGEVETIEAPSPARALPPCRHFGRCGGCVLQHWQDAAYRTWKSGLLEGALRGAGFDTPGAIELVAGLPGERRRLPFEQRWPGVMERGLAADGLSVRVVENSAKLEEIGELSLKGLSQAVTVSNVVL